MTLISASHVDAKQGTYRAYHACSNGKRVQQQCALDVNEGQLFHLPQYVVLMSGLWLQSISSLISVTVLHNFELLAPVCRNGDVTGVTPTTFKGSTAVCGQQSNPGHPGVVVL